MAQVLTDNVIVCKPNTYEGILLVAGSPLPSWAKGLVGSHVLADADTAGETDTGSADEVADTGSDAKVDDGPMVPGKPGGKGGSAKAWAKYADALGFEIEDVETATAQEIYDALAAEGVPVE